MDDDDPLEGLSFAPAVRQLMEAGDETFTWHDAVRLMLWAPSAKETVNDVMMAVGPGGLELSAGAHWPADAVGRRRFQCPRPKRPRDQDIVGRAHGRDGPDRPAEKRPRLAVGCVGGPGSPRNATASTAPRAAVPNPFALRPPLEQPRPSFPNPVGLRGTEGGVRGDDSARDAAAFPAPVASDRSAAMPNPLAAVRRRTFPQDAAAGGGRMGDGGDPLRAAVFGRQAARPPALSAAQSPVLRRRVNSFNFPADDSDDDPLSPRYSPASNVSLADWDQPRRPLSPLSAGSDDLSPAAQRLMDEVFGPSGEPSNGSIAIDNRRVGNSSNSSNSSSSSHINNANNTNTHNTNSQTNNSNISQAQGNKGNGGAKGMPKNSVKGAAMPDCQHVLHAVEAASLDLPVDEKKMPKKFGVKLLRFQKQTVTWMIAKEDAAAAGPPLPPGGIIATEMGLGKTIMSAAVIVAQRQRLGAGVPVAERGTLVLTHCSLLEQWRNQVSLLRLSRRLYHMQLGLPKVGGDGVWLRLVGGHAMPRRAGGRTDGVCTGAAQPLHLKYWQGLTDRGAKVMGTFWAERVGDRGSCGDFHSGLQMGPWSRVTVPIKAFERGEISKPPLSKEKPLSRPQGLWSWSWGFVIHPHSPPGRAFGFPQLLKCCADLRVLIYHGDKRHRMPKKDLAEADVIISTLLTLQLDQKTYMRKQVQQAVACVGPDDWLEASNSVPWEMDPDVPALSRKFQRVIYDEAHSLKPDKVRTCATGCQRSWAILRVAPTPSQQSKHVCGRPVRSGLHQSNGLSRRHPMLLPCFLVRAECVCQQ